MRRNSRMHRSCGFKSRLCAACRCTGSVQKPLLFYCTAAIRWKVKHCHLNKVPKSSTLWFKMGISQEGGFVFYPIVTWNCICPLSSLLCFVFCLHYSMFTKNAQVHQYFTCIDCQNCTHLYKIFSFIENSHSSGTGWRDHTERINKRQMFLFVGHAMIKEINK